VLNKLFKNEKLIIVDVGASGGVQMEWLPFREFCEFYLFEPDERAVLKNDNDNIFIQNYGLSDSNETMDIFLCRKQQVSSIYEPNHELLTKYPAPERFDVLKKEKLQVHSMHDVLKVYPDFVKLDVQGHELAVIKGMKDLINSVIGLEVEVSFIEIYKKQPLFSEVDNYLKNNGFQLFDLKRYFWRRDAKKNYGSLKGQLSFAEALYLRSPEYIIENFAKDKSEIFKSILIYKKYGYYDLIEILAELAKENNIIVSKDYDHIMDICSLAEDQSFPILGKGRIQNDEILGNQ